jgi:hypothetical protein
VECGQGTLFGDFFGNFFDDFCDADEPKRFLGVSLRTEEEVTLMRELGVALNAAAAEAPIATEAGGDEAPWGSGAGP